MSERAVSAIRVDLDVLIAMRDGVVLRADVFRADNADASPALVIRMPYNKAAPRYHPYFDPVRVVRQGYAVVWQDCRGTMFSEGDFYPVVAEAEDGYDTLEWVASQPWCNGQIGMYGLSYHGLTQLAAASAQSPHLKAMFPAMVGHGLRDLLYRGGAFQLHLALFLSFHLSLLASARDAVRGHDTRKSAEALTHAFDNLEAYAKCLPLKGLAVLRETGRANYYFDWLDHPDNDEYWVNAEFAPYDRITLPAYLATGWYDVQLHGTLANYLGMKACGGSKTARREIKLLIGPWIHSVELSQQVGELNFGLRAAGAGIDYTGIQLRWFDRWLKGRNNGITAEAPVRLFVMNENVWRNEEEWPLARTQYTPYYLHSDGQANTLDGNGRLDREPPGKERCDTYAYDPAMPVATHGGAMLTFSGAGAGALDQRAVHSRPDVLVYTSAVLGEEVEVTGPITLKLFAASTARDTDFTAKLEDVWPSGQSYLIADGIIRARYRLGDKRPDSLEPGEVYEFIIDLGATSNLFKAGHRIRVSIASSNFPKYDRNPNTGHAFGESSALTVARQTIFHDHRSPSHVVLPVIPR
ncbi:MAG: CocE/NonD family hydrolase [Gammaproteobacteria bacterium]